MSRHHHDQAFYDFSRERWPRCFFCGQRPVQQMHHLSAVGSAYHRGVAPRRSSTYNAVGVCDECHDAVHDSVGERRMIEAFLGGREEMYRQLTRRLHEYIDYLRGAG